MDTVYSSSPWVVPPDPETTADIFRRLGRPVTLRARSLINFGSEQKVYLLQTGIAATFVGGVGSYERMAAIFTAGSTLGAVKAMTHRGIRMDLQARIYREARALQVDTSQFMRELDRDPKTCAAAAVNFVLKNEATVDGLLLNGLLKIPERLARMIPLLCRLDGAPLTDAWQPLPDCFTVTDLSTMIHSNRVTVSRVLARWAKDGLIRFEEGEWLFNSGLERAFG